jgi:hypothetical protein
MSDDIVREVRVLVDASVCTNPPIHKYSKFDRTLVVPAAGGGGEELHRLMVVRTTAAGSRGSEGHLEEPTAK